MTYYGEVPTTTGTSTAATARRSGTDEGAVWDGEHRRPRRSIVGDDHQNQNQNQNQNHRHNKRRRERRRLRWCGPRPRREPSTHRTAEACEAPRTDGGAPDEAPAAQKRGLGPVGEGRSRAPCPRPTKTRVTDHALILRFSPRSPRVVWRTTSARGEARRRHVCDGGGASEATRLFGAPPRARRDGSGRKVGDRGGTGKPQRRARRRTPARAGPRVVEGGRRRRRRGLRADDDGGGGGRRGRASRQKKKKRVALVIDGFTHLAHRARPGRCFEAFGVPRPPSSNRRWGVGVPSGRRVGGRRHPRRSPQQGGAPSARYRATRGFRGENNGAHTPGAHFGVNYGARGCPYARG